MISAIALRQLAYAVVGIGIVCGHVHAQPPPDQDIVARWFRAGALIGSFLVLLVGDETAGRQARAQSGPVQSAAFRNFSSPASPSWPPPCWPIPASCPRRRPVLTFLLLLPALIILLLQPDVGQTGLLLCLWGAMLFFWGLPLMWVGAMAGGACAWRGRPMQIFPHVHNRVNQYLGHSETGYQAGLALKAFAHGGLTGVGPGEGTIKYRLPDAHADFVFATAGEEFGSAALRHHRHPVLRADGAAAAARGGGARSLRPAGGRGPGRGHRRAGLHQYGRGGVAAAGQGHDPAVSFPMAAPRCSPWR